jgi:hypothetical protein
MVTFQTPDGTPGFHQSETLDEAITFVERLRNEQGVHNSRIFRMEELKFDFKPYYKVEISAADSGGIAPPERATPSSRPAPPKADPALDLTDHEPVAPEKVEAPEPVGVAASVESTPPASSEASAPLPPPPPPAKDTKSDEPSEPPRRGLFTR